MPTKTLTYQAEGHDVQLVLGSATTLSGIKRAMLQGRALAYLDGNPMPERALEAAALRIAVQYLYPDLLAAVVEAKGVNPEMAVAEFLALPQALTDAWQNQVYALNPHWYPFKQNEADPEAEKKDGAPVSSDSDSSS